MGVDQGCFDRSEVFAFAADDDDAAASQIGGEFLSYALHQYSKSLGDGRENARGSAALDG